MTTGCTEPMTGWRKARAYGTLVLVVLGAAWLLGTRAFAGTGDAPSADLAAVKAKLNARFPGAAIRDLRKTNYAGGLYEARVGDQFLYTDQVADVVIVGAVYDSATKENLTDARARELNRIDVKVLPVAQAIKRVKGDGSRTLYLFSDPDCPYCGRFEGALKDIDNVTIHTFLLPIDNLHPNANKRARQIWCAPNSAQAWDDFMGNRGLPVNDGSCPTPVPANQTLAAGLGINSTPTLVFADGSVVPGAITREQVEANFARAANAVKAK